MQAFLGAVANALSKEDVEEAPEQLPGDTRTATVSRVVGRLSRTEKFLTPFIELTEVSGDDDELTSPGFPLTKKLMNLDLKVDDCITFTAKISNTNGCLVHPKILKVERPNNTTKNRKVLRFAKPKANVLGRKSERLRNSKRLLNTYERGLKRQIAGINCPRAFAASSQNSAMRLNCFTISPPKDRYR